MIRRIIAALILGAMFIFVACAGSDAGPNSVGTDFGALELQPANLVLQVSQSQQITTNAFDGPENSLPDGAQLIFRVNNQAGRISQDGRFTGSATAGIYPDAITVEISVGSVVIRTRSANVTLIAGPLNHIILEPSNATVQMSHKQRFIASAFDRFNNPIVGLKFAFDAEAQTGHVDGEGNFTAGTNPGPHPGGISVSTVENSVSFTASADVTVVGPIDRLVLDPDTPTLQVGQIKRFRVFAYDELGNSIPKSMYQQAFNVNKDVGIIDRRGTLIAGALIGTFTDGVFVQITQGSLVRRIATDVTLVRGPVNQVVRYPVDSESDLNGISSNAYDRFGNQILDPIVLQSLDDESTARTFLLRGPDNALVWLETEIPSQDNADQGEGNILEVVLEFDVLTGDYWVTVGIDRSRPLTGNFRFNLNLANRRTGPSPQSTAGLSVSLWQQIDADSADSLAYSGRNGTLTTWRPGDRITTFGPLFNSGINDNNIEASGYVVGNSTRP